MKSLAAIEINIDGIIISIATEQQTFWQPILPIEGDCIFSFWNHTVNRRITEFTNKIFHATFPSETSIFINSLPIDLIGCINAVGNATIYFKHTAENAESKTSIPDLKLKLLDFTFKNANNPIQLLHEDGSMYDFNNAMCNLLGYNIEEYKNINFIDTDPYNNPEGYAILWKNIKVIGDLIIFRKLKRKDGSIIDVEINTSFISFKGKELNCCFVSDITDKKKTDERLKIINFAFHHAATPILLIKEDGTFYDCNQAAQDLLGYTREQLLSLKSYKVDPLITKEFRQKLWKNLHSNGSIEMQQSFLHRNGSIIELDIKSNLVTYGGLELNCTFITDVTEKKALNERLNLVNYSFQHVSTPIIMVKNDGSFYDFNIALLNLLGYTREEMEELEVIDIDPDASQEVRKNIWDTIRANKTMLQYRQMKKKDGTFVDLEIRANLFLKGDLELNCAFLTDITENKKAEKDRLNLIDELVDSNKELIQFSYITSHNLRAPITNLISICKRLNPDNIKDDLTKNLIEGFKQSTCLLNETLNDLIKILIIKQNTSIALTNVSFEEIFDKVHRSVSAITIQNAVQIRTDFNAAPTVNFSNIYLESIFLNLLTNSIKYAHPSRYPIINIKSFIDSEENTVLTFQDNGIGMDMHRVQNKIFGLYQRFHNNPDGKGIGLYLVHSQITALGGSIKVDSEVNEGTTFTITFPQTVYTS